MKVPMLGSMTLGCILVYLFVSAPPPLPEGDEPLVGPSVDIAKVLAFVAAENAAAREIYTASIVGPGMELGWKFDENWRKSSVHAGPLPALFLRETALLLERSSVRLGLFLGSDFPISRANRFTGEQQKAFERLKGESLPSIDFYAQDTKLYTSMFPDYAAAQPCITCHNEHPNTTKDDWQFGQMMGATTWTYPKGSVDIVEAADLIRGLREAIRGAYEAVLAEASTWPQPPEVGNCWPKDGYCLPDAETFMRYLADRVSGNTMKLFVEELARSRPARADESIGGNLSMLGVVPAGMVAEPPALRDGGHVEITFSQREEGAGDADGQTRG